ncbi:MAG: 2Fe-2S ferredoxin [Flammeovirgaceae bacterium]|jgi:2Fe-2S ferredoxin
MASIKIKNMNGFSLKVNNNSESILKNIQENNIDWMFACGGKGKCTTCRAEIIEGLEQLPPPNEAELAKADRLLPNERLTCQTIIGDSDLVLRVPTPCQFPHIEYKG